MDIKFYAPVIIPTLNRFDHFKRCLESLERCTWAEYTDVYVGLDFPPSEKYIDGWKKIDAYLVEKEKNNGFLHLFVYRRDHNCGVCNPGSNFSLLLNECKKVSDVFILSEDDNEFSPNFLDYINKGLEKYKDNPNIYGICGYNYPVEISDYQHEYYFSHEFSGWGCGTWIEKREKVFKIIRNPKYIIDFYKKYPVNIYLKNSFKLLSLATRLGDGFLGDVYLTTYLYSRNMFCVFPKVSKVRNWGHDGSGTNCGKLEGKLEGLFSSQHIDDKDYAFFDDDLALNVNSYVDKRVQSYMKPTKKNMLKRFLCFILLRLYTKLK